VPSRHQDPELQADAHHSGDGARWASLRLGTERARAAAVARAELACIRRAEMRATQVSAPSPPVDASASDDDEDPSGVSATPWISPQHHRSAGVRTDPDWDALWDSGVTAAVAAARSPPQTSGERMGERSRRGHSRATAALLRAQNGDARTLVPHSRMSGRRQLGAESSLLALQKRVAEAKQTLERRERSSRPTSLSDCADTRAGLPRRTRSAGDDARTSMAAIKRVAQRRVVSIELTEDSLEQEALWRSRRLQLQQARLHSKGTAADQKSSSPGGWLGFASLSVRANGEHGSGLLIHSDSQSAAPSDADEREMYQQVGPRHTERPLQHEPLMHGHGSSRGGGCGGDDSSRRLDTEAYSETQRETQTHETQPDTETHTEIQRDSDDDSDDFGSGDGLHAEPETPPSPKLSASLPRDMQCLQGHELLAFETPIDGYKCDECGAIVGAGHLMHSCRPCEHDVCEDCVRSRIPLQKFSLPEKPAHPSMLDEVGVTTEGTCPAQ
jgi:hypothetical protein